MRPSSHCPTTTPLPPPLLQTPTQECPWCKEKVSHTVMDEVLKRKDAEVSLFRQLGNGVIKLVVWAVFVCGIGVLVLNNDWGAPKTLHGYTCEGIFVSRDVWQPSPVSRHSQVTAP